MPIYPRTNPETISGENEVRPEYPDRSLQAVANNIAKGADALTLSSALSELYLGGLQRVLNVRAAFDRVRELETAEDPQWKRSMRAARFAVKDEEKLLRLLDRAIRGLCDCQGIRARRYLETIAEMDARKYQEAPEELRAQHVRDLFLLTMYQKALLYHLDIPEELLNRDMEDQLRVFVEKRTPHSE